MNTSTEGFQQRYNAQVTLEGEYGRGPHKHRYSGFAGSCVVGLADLLDTETKEKAAMPMKDPPHPGRIVRQDCIAALELTVSRAAEPLSVTRQTLSNLVNEKSGISAEIAIRLEKLGWSTADHWMRLQAAYDLAQARRTQDQIKVGRCEPYHT